MAKEGLGIINWWGFTPAIDLYSNGMLPQGDSMTGDINVLLVGCGDCRHVLKTISSLRRRPDQSIYFYIAENGIELYARHMLQMIIAMIPPSRLGLQDKTELFLETYGNSLVREQSMEFVKELSNRLIRLITDPERCTQLLPFLDLDHLTFKERDILESVFKIWRDSNPKTFDMSLCWDLRIRQHLGSRYDAIPNVFDWDCSITLHDRGADIIGSREYCHWRQRGVAFQLRDARYDASNRTLASGRVLRAADGDKTVRLGYWGDIVVSPFIAFGIISSNQALFRKANNKYNHNATRVSEFNVSEMFHQLAHGTPYEQDDGEIGQSTNSTTAAGALPLTITEVDEEAECNEDGVDVISDRSQSTQSTLTMASHGLDELPKHDVLPLPLMSGSSADESASCSWCVDEHVKLVFLPLSKGRNVGTTALPDLLTRKDKFKGIFDLVYFSAGLVGQLENSVLPDLLRSSRSHATGDSHRAVVVVETPQFVVDVNAEQLQCYVNRSNELARSHGLEAISSITSNKTGHLVYRTTAAQRN